LYIAEMISTPKSVKPLPLERFFSICRKNKGGSSKVTVEQLWKLFSFRNFYETSRDDNISYQIHWFILGIWLHVRQQNKVSWILPVYRIKTVEFYLHITATAYVSTFMGKEVGTESVNIIHRDSVLYWANFRCI
jgi:hypothetical protein